MYNYFLIILVFFPFLILILFKPVNSIYIILIFCYIQGLMALLYLPSMLRSLLVELPIIFLLLFSIFNNGQKSKKFLMPMLWLYSILALVTLISAIINGSIFFESLLFFRYLILPYGLFLAIYNLDYNERKTYLFNKVLFVMVIVQIIATIIKLLSIGVQEKIVGTLHVTSGSMATIFPLIIIGYVLSFYLIKRKKGFLLYLILIIGMLLISYASSKKAIWIMLPLVVTLVYLMYLFLAKISIYKAIFRFCVFISLFLLLSYLGFRLHPSLNPEGIVWGSFDIDHIITFTQEYETREYQAAPAGRFATTNYTFKLISSNIKSFLFGFGPDSLLRPEEGSHRGAQFNIRYGITGQNYMFLSIGFLGYICIVIIYLLFGKMLFMKFKEEDDPYWKSLILGTLIANIIILLDFFAYSPQIIGHAIPITHFYMLGIIFNKHRNDFNKEEISI